MDLVDDLLAHARLIETFPSSLASRRALYKPSLTDTAATIGARVALAPSAAGRTLWRCSCRTRRRRSTSGISQGAGLSPASTTASAGDRLAVVWIHLRQIESVADNLGTSQQTGGDYLRDLPGGRPFGAAQQRDDDFNRSIASDSTVR